MAIGDLMGMMKQAKQLQEKMEQMQHEVAAMEIEGAAGGGLVRVVTNGKSELKSIRIDPSLLKPEESEILEDLIVTAINDARGKAEARLAERMQEVTGGLQLPPGMKLPF
jgi:DNA-binding YbaB/EbfC family protein